MKIPTKKTVTLIEEIPTDGHSPLKFLCADDDIYYCKYRVNPKEVELDCLIYEVICNALLTELGIPTPEIALVEIIKGTYNRKDLNKNKYIYPGVICFGSKELETSQLVTELDKISNVNDFNTYKNPNDLIRIALFDLWVGNKDRGKSGSAYSPGRSNNYNLLTKPEGNQIMIVAFDHGFAFEGEVGFRIFNEKWLPDKIGKLFGTQFFIDMLTYISLEKKEKLIYDFVTKIKGLNIDELITPVLNQLPNDWIRHEPLKNKIIKYLESEDRIKELEEVAKTEIINR